MKRKSRKNVLSKQKHKNNDQIKDQCETKTFYFFLFSKTNSLIKILWTMLDVTNITEDFARTDYSKI